MCVYVLANMHSDHELQDPAEDVCVGCLAGAVQWDEEHISYNFDVRKGPISVEWFKGGTTNICYNALDRHVAAGET